MANAVYTLRERDGTPIADISDKAHNKRSRRRLGAAGWAECLVPSHLCSPGIAGATTLLVEFPEYGFFHNGIVITAEDQAQDDEYWTLIKSLDPRWWWFKRYVQDADGDWSKPTILTDFVTATEILEAAIANTIANDGEMGISVGTVETGGPDVTGANVDWPIRLLYMTRLLEQTGQVDVIVDPVDDGSTYGEVSLYNGDHGTDLSTGSNPVSFAYGTGAFNCKAMKKVDDFSNIGNKLFDQLGPKIDDQHWRGNIQIDDPGLPNQAEIEAIALASRDEYGVFMDIEVIDADYIVAVEMYRYRYEMKTRLRRKPKEMVYADLDDGIGLGEFDICDKVGIAGGTMLRGGFSGTQRVYGYTVAESEEGVRSIQELETSADQESDE